MNTIDTYLRDHRVFSLFKNYRKEYKQKAVDYYLPLVQKTREEGVSHLLTFWNTWDYFDVALRFLNMYAQNHMDYPEYLDTLFRMVHPSPEKRPTILHLRNQNKKAIQSFDLSSSKSTYTSIDKHLTDTVKKN